MLRIETGCAAALASLMLFAEPAFAEETTGKEPPASLGNLTCTFGAEVEGAIAAGHAQAVLCVYLSNAANAEELYVGTAYFSGPAAAPGDVSLSWTVKGPREMFSIAGGLEQSYTVQGAAGGDPENSAPLVGQDTEAIVLHPLSLPSGEAKDAMTAEARKIAVLELKLKTTIA